MADELFPSSEAFAAQADALKRRRALAQQLIQKGLTSAPAGQMVSGFYVPANPWENFVNAAAGSYLDSKADADEGALAARQQQAAQTIIKRLGQQGEKEQMGPTADGSPMPMQPLSPDEESARRLSVMGEGMSNPSIRALLEKQMGQELDYPRQREIEKAKATIEANRLAAQDERQAKLFQQQGEMLDKRFAGQKELRQIPTIHISNSGGGGGSRGIKAPSGYRYNEDGTALEAIPGGPHDVSTSKPVKLTAAQQKAYDDSDVLLGHIDNARAAIKANPKAIGFKTVIPDMALSKIDPEGVSARAAVGGLSAERVHQLSGAAVSPAEFSRLRPYLPASGDTAEAALKKLDSLYGEVQRIKAAHARGPTMADPKAKAPTEAKTVVREVKLKDGRTGVEYSDGTRGFK